MDSHLKMPTNENSSSIAAASFRGRSSPSTKRNQFFSLDGYLEQEYEEISLFNRNVADKFIGLLAESESSIDVFLSASWLRKLIATFLSSIKEFKTLITHARNADILTKPPMDRLMNDWLDRILKAVDICNAVAYGVDALEYWQKQAYIAVSSLSKKQRGEGKIQRARKALRDLMGKEEEGKQDGNQNQKTAERSWSFGGGGRKSNGQSRNSISKIWLTVNFKQIQAMSANMGAPRSIETNGLGQAIYTMSYVTVFVIWTMVAAIPCQDHLLVIPLTLPPKQTPWALAMVVLHDQILNEWKRREKKAYVMRIEIAGMSLLGEMRRLERCVQDLMDLTPSSSTQEDDVQFLIEELSDICGKMEKDLKPMRSQIREMFRCMVNVRIEIMDCLSKSNRLTAQIL